MAGERGIGALGFQFVSADAAHAWVNTYYNAFTKRQRKLADYQTNPNIALVSGFMCAETDEEAMRKADGWTFFQFALGFYARRNAPVAPGEINLWEEYLNERHGKGPNSTALRPCWFSRNSTKETKKISRFTHRSGHFT
jgi:alkanesulfonate monooxygenase SsuD/methylene tetrahydromethanopterin reductase-like flavin-dependent oxidoreductase (luciferase family)